MTQEPVIVHLAIIAAYSILAHAIILLDDGLHWDGWIVDSWQRTRNWPVMRRFYAEAGLLPLYYFHKLLASAPSRILIYRLIAFGSTLASGVAIYLLGIQSSILSPFYSLLIALLYLSYTGYHMNVDTVVGAQYTFPTALFYWATYLALLAADCTGLTHWSLRALSLLLFFLAFNANSTLVYYFGFLGLKSFLSWDASADSVSNAYREIIGHADYIVLPFAYWYLKNQLMPRHGHYMGYNRIRLHLPNAAVRLFNAVRSGFEASITLPVRSAFAHHYVWIPASVFALTFWIASDANGSSGTIPPAAAVMLVGIGFALLMLAALPYTVVGLNFYPGGWATKHHMLFHLPVSLIVLGIAALLASPSVLLATVALMLTNNAIYLNLTYLQYIAAAVKNRSWLYKLSRIADAKEKSVFLVTDSHSIRGDPYIPEQEHRPAYFFYMFEWLWGDKSRIGIPVQASAPERLPVDQVAGEIDRTTLGYDMQQVNARGGQAKVIISDGAIRSPLRIALLYLYGRLAPRAGVTQVLERATEIQYHPL